MGKTGERHVEILLDHAVHGGDLYIPTGASGIVIFAHGSGSSRHSPRNQYVASKLHAHRIGTFLFDLLTEAEDRDYMTRFDIDLLSRRLVDATTWLSWEPEARGLPLGYFGASTGAAAALRASTVLGSQIKAVVSRGGRPDLAGEYLPLVRSATLLIVGGEDREVIRLNKVALAKIHAPSELSIVPNAGHLFEEPGKLENVAELAAYWFVRFLDTGQPEVAAPSL